MPLPIPSDSYRSKEEALTAFRLYHSNVLDVHAVYCADLKCWIHSDDAHQCEHCSRHFYDDLEMQDGTGLCLDCWKDD